MMFDHTNLFARFSYSIKSRCLTDYLAIAIAISIPWSTSATSILMVIWLVAFLFTLNFADLRTEIFTPAGGIPFLLFAWAAFGMLWANITWTESFAGLRQFDKLIFIPVLLAYFRRSNIGMWVIAGFVISCIALLILSLIITLRPELQWRPGDLGVPVKNYITQSVEFAISAFWLFYISIDAWKERQHIIAILASLIALAFVGDLVFVVTSRTELIVIATLIFLFGARLYGWRGLLLGVTALSVAMLIAWHESSYLRDRIHTTQLEIKAYDMGGKISSTAYRIQFLRTSIDIITAAPLIGHGTGTIRQLFEQSAIGKTGVSAVVTSNPHNQVFAVAIQLGLVGTAVLCVMWLMHVMMFLGPGMAAWFGFVIVIQNIIGSLFNTHLFDFTEGWIYVCLVGVLGGMCTRRDIDTHWLSLYRGLRLGRKNATAVNE